LDSQEHIVLQDGSTATVCNIREPFGAAMIASHAFDVGTEHHRRRLAGAEVQQTLRSGFTEWETLPDCVLNDNEVCQADGSKDRFPGSLTLWLVGLGVQHRFIRPRCPTDQPHIERNHLTMDNLAMNEESLVNLTTLQQSLDYERSMYNSYFPSRASDCNGRPPLVAHPELLHPRRPYRPECELALFDLQRVYDYLATFTFERKVSEVGRVSLGRQLYSVGRPWAGCTVLAKFDPETGEWVFHVKEPEESGENEERVVRRAAKDLDVATLTGLDPQDFAPVPPIQLTFPCFV
jgi:hypothetical protein